MQSSPQAGSRPFWAIWARHGVRSSRVMRTLRRRRHIPDAPRILTIRGLKVVLDEDLARLYAVTTGQLNQALKRNRQRFPKDFAFQLNVTEYRNLKSQSVISSGAHGGRRKRPWVFTEHGALMAASVLSTARAIEMSIFVVRAFLRLREITEPHRELAAKLDELERRVMNHDDELQAILAALRQLIQPPSQPRRAIGFAMAATMAPLVTRAFISRRRRSDK